VSRAKPLEIDESEIFADVDNSSIPETRESRYNREHRNQRRVEDKIRDRQRRENRKIERRHALMEKEFCVWDGEGSSVPDGEPQPFILFGNTDGEYRVSPKLGTKECLDLIVKADSQKIHVSFAFGYDVNQILCDLSHRVLSILNWRNSVRWEGYIIEYIPEKWFAVSKNGIRTTIFDSFHFFNRALVSVLEDYKIGTVKQRAFLARQKKNRPHFKWDEIDEVLRYWWLENQLTKELLGYVRGLFNAAGFFPRSWHGPGALARELLKNNDVKLALCDTRKEHLEVWIAARYGYSGGRFEQFQAGQYIGEVFNYDVRSAYPYAIQFLPNLATGTWHRRLRVDRNKIRRDRFCIYHIKYRSAAIDEEKNMYHRRRPRPLFRRTKNDNICWPDMVEGWYWSPEAELVKDDPAAEFVEGWEYEDDGSRPLSFISKVYETREYHKELGNAIELAFKLAMNSCYGQFAQRAGWESVKPKPGPPPYHQLEWAGFVTSMCKAMVHRVAEYAYSKGGLITIDTDGVFSTVRIPQQYLPGRLGKGLGQWEEKRYDGIAIWQNGFYWLKEGNSWKKCRSRGAPRGTIEYEKVSHLIPRLECRKAEIPGSLTKELTIEFSRKRFVGFRQSIRSYRGWQKWRCWIDEPKKIEFGGGPGSKRQHTGRWECRACHKNSGSMHTLHVMPLAYEDYKSGGDIWSFMHNLPWLDPDDKAVETADFPEEDEIWEDVSL
jgi:DNA polymerase type B, organellar and viral